MYAKENLFGNQISTRQWPYIPNVINNKIVKADLAMIQPEIIEMPSGIVRVTSATGFLIIFETSNHPEKARHSYEWEGELIRFINEDIKPYSHNSGVNPNYDAGIVNTLVNSILNLFTKKEEKKDAERLVAKKYKDYDQFKNFNIIVNAQRSWQDELTRTTNFDKRLVFDYAAAVILIFLYMALVNRTKNYVRSKSICGIMGAVSALLGFAAGAGICYAFGLKHTPTMHATPFLVLAIGLDNTFVVLNFYTLGFTFTKNPKLRCQNALAESCIALFITTLTSIVSFVVGAIGPYTAIRNFCIITSFGLLGGFIFNIIFFYPILCLEAKAESQGRIWFLPDRLLARLRFSRLTIDSYKIWLRERARHSRSNPVPIYSINSNQPRLPDNENNREYELPDVVIDTSMMSIDSNNPEGYRSENESRYLFDISDLRKKFMNSRTMFEVATIQWTLTKLRNSILSEKKRRKTQNTDSGRSVMNSENNNMEVANNIRRYSSTVSYDSVNINSGNLSISAIDRILTKNTLDSTSSETRKEFTELSNASLNKLSVIVEGALHISAEPEGTKGRKTHLFILRHLGPLFQILGIFYLSAGLDLEHLTPPDSYLREAFDLSHSKIQLFPQQTEINTASPLGSVMQQVWT
uniref:Uncharacterized protein LOC113796757 n=1 Tax=Dermatophagoides pteronyssinus TaxID=6956 RepID=A0A6P6YD81_DERPT|nr:uncharacterized protein LOC113796757 [Dermatophagoides pteronyssinus]